MPRFDQTLILPIPASCWEPPAQPVTLDGIRLEPKDELHATLIGGALGSELRRSLDPARLEREVDTLFRRFDWAFSRTGRFLLLCKPFREGGRLRVAHSVIEFIELPAMAPFHRALGQLLGRELPVPPPHVTLYVAGRREGIGIRDRGQLRGLAVRAVSASELPAA